MSDPYSNLHADCTIKDLEGSEDIDERLNRELEKADLEIDIERNDVE